MAGPGFHRQPAWVFIAAVYPVPRLAFLAVFAVCGRIPASPPLGPPVSGRRGKCTVSTELES